MDYNINPKLYSQILWSINQRSLHDCRLGSQQDMAFIKKEDWLSDSAVLEYMTYRKGTWDIFLLFAHYQTPLKFLMRKITSQNNKKKADLIASIYKRQAAKDQRGTLVLDTRSIVKSPN